MDSSSRGQRALTGYYLATPVFLLIDYLFGQNIRIVALESYPSLKFLYYIVCSLSGFWMLRIRAWPDLFALAESSTNILLLIMGLLTLYLKAVEAATRGEVQVGITPQQVINFIFAGAVGAIAFYSNRLVRPRA